MEKKREEVQCCFLTVGNAQQQQKKRERVISVRKRENDIDMSYIVANTQLRQYNSGEEGRHCSANLCVQGRLKKKKKQLFNLCSRASPETLTLALRLHLIVDEHLK